MPTRLAMNDDGKRLARETVMKKFINAPADVVREALAGVAAAHPDLRVDGANQIVVRVDAGAGVVHVVKNYTGDVMNFQLAAELAGDEGIDVQTVLVDDDVAVESSTWTAGRRGTGATLIVEKIAGARAEEGASIADVVAAGQRVNERSASFAVALTACTTPAAGRPGFDLPDDEMEVGVGIHGEPGRRREKLQPA